MTERALHGWQGRAPWPSSEGTNWERHENPCRDESLSPPLPRGIRGSVCASRGGAAGVRARCLCVDEHPRAAAEPVGRPAAPHRPGERHCRASAAESVRVPPAAAASPVDPVPGVSRARRPEGVHPPRRDLSARYHQLVEHVGPVQDAPALTTGVGNPRRPLGRALLDDRGLRPRQRGPVLVLDQTVGR